MENHKVIGYICVQCACRTKFNKFIKWFVILAFSNRSGSWNSEKIRSDMSSFGWENFRVWQNFARPSRGILCLNFCIILAILIKLPVRRRHAHRRLLICLPPCFAGCLAFSFSSYIYFFCFLSWYWYTLYRTSGSGACGTLRIRGPHFNHCHCPREFIWIYYTSPASSVFYLIFEQMQPSVIMVVINPVVLWNIIVRSKKENLRIVKLIKYQAYV